MKPDLDNLVGQPMNIDSGDAGANDAGKTEDKSTIRSLARSIHVIQAINRHGSLALTEIARATGIPFPTAYRIVNTLIEEGLIEREPTRKRYRPTALIQSLACGFQNHDRLVNVARPIMTEFTQKYHWPLSVVTRVGNKMVVRYHTSWHTTLTFNNYYPGWQVPLLASASGQVYIAFAEDHIQESLLSQANVMEGVSDPFILKEFQSGRACQRIRDAGYATVSKAHFSANPGKTSSLAVPLFEGGELVGSLALVFFANGMSLEKAAEDFFGAIEDVAGRIDEELRRTPAQFDGLRSLN